MAEEEEGEEEGEGGLKPHLEAQKREGGEGGGGGEGTYLAKGGATGKYVGMEVEMAVARLRDRRGK